MRYSNQFIAGIFADFHSWLQNWVNRDLIQGDRPMMMNKGTLADISFLTLFLRFESFKIFRDFIFYGAATRLKTAENGLK